MSEEPESDPTAYSLKIYKVYLPNLSTPVCCIPAWFVLLLLDGWFTVVGPLSIINGSFWVAPSIHKIVLLKFTLYVNGWPAEHV